MNVKSEIRNTQNPKEGRSPKAETTTGMPAKELLSRGRGIVWIRISDFGLLSAFGFRVSVLLPAWVCLLMLVPAVQAQNAPHIGYVYPAGGRQGTTFQVVVGGVLVFAVGIWIGSS